jgi:hypothetical protein
MSVNAFNLSGIDQTKTLMADYGDELHFQEIDYGTVGRSITYLFEYILEKAQFIFEIAEKSLKKDVDVLLNIDDNVKNLLNSDIFLNMIVFNLIDEIKSSSPAFTIEIESIEINKRKTTDYLEHENIITKVKVPKEKRMKEIDAFWNHIGRTLSQIIDDLELVCPEKAAKINKSLLVIVSNR